MFSVLTSAVVTKFFGKRQKINYQEPPESPIRLKKLIIATGSWSGVSRITTVGVQVVTTSLLSRRLDSEALGLWMLLATVVGHISLLDFGLSSANIGLAASVHIRSGVQGVRAAILRSLYLTTVIAGFGYILGLFFLDSSFAGFILAEKKHSQVQLFAAMATLCFPIAFLNIPLNAVSQFTMGIGKGHWIGISQIVGQVLSLTALFLGLNAGLSLPSLALACLCGPTAANFIVLIKLLRLVRLQCGDSSTLSTLSYCEYLKAGLPFFIIQMGGLVSYGFDAIIIAKYISLSGVSAFLLMQKLFYLPGVVSSAFLNATWPAYARARELGDFGWISKCYSRSLRVSLSFSALFALLICISCPIFFPIWTDGKVDFDFSLMVCFFLWSILNSIGGVQAMVLNGIGEAKLQAKAIILVAPLNFFLSLLLVKKIGSSGPIVASLLVLSSLYTFYFFTIRKRLERLGVSR